MAQGIGAVRTSVAGVIAGVSGVGTVHNRMRLAALEAEVKALYVVGSVLKFWAVCLADDDPYIESRRPANHAHATYKYSLHGFWAVDDATSTEVTFAGHVEDVIEAFRANKKLGGTVMEAGPAQWRESQYRTFAGVLCHYARLELAVLEQVEP